MKEIKITNPDKILFPKDKLRKIDIINYYIEVSNLMLPYIKNRLLSVIRCHEGIDGEKFFKKHPTNDKGMVQIYLEGKEEYFYISKNYELIYQAQMGTIEFHIWGSNIKNLENPNFMVFDLDPDENLSLNKLRKSVLKVKSVLDKLNLKSYLKTSGGKGYHIVVPFASSKDYASFYDFSKQIALIVENNWKEDFTTNLKKEKRKGKIFIDYLRNNRGSTCVAPYSIRARDGAPISMPISWEDLFKIKPNEVTIKNYKKYINNAWEDFFEIKQKLK
ncbi:MAG: non-homologous end-joining DNA ligase [Christensenellales bacterium]